MRGLETYCLLVFPRSIAYLETLAQLTLFGNGPSLPLVDNAPSLGGHPSEVREESLARVIDCAEFPDPPAIFPE